MGPRAWFAPESIKPRWVEKMKSCSSYQCNAKSSKNPVVIPARKKPNLEPQYSPLQSNEASSDPHPRDHQILSAPCAHPSASLSERQWAQRLHAAADMREPPNVRLRPPQKPSSGNRRVIRRYMRRNALFLVYARYVRGISWCIKPSKPWTKMLAFELRVCVMSDS